MTSTIIDKKNILKRKVKEEGVIFIEKGLNNKQNNKINKNSRHARYTVKIF